MDQTAWDEPQVVETPFLDGRRFIPHHLAMMMNGMPTATMLYEEAVAAANQRAVGDILGKAQTNLLRDHFARQRHGSDL